MAVVRCPIHNIPYNAANPRGCPACAQTEATDDSTRLMRDLARASRGIPTVEVLPADDEGEEVERLSEWGPVTTPPRVPTPEPTRLQRTVWFFRRNRLSVIGFGLGGVGLWLMWLVTRPTFAAAFVPPLVVAGQPARPFPVEPNSQMIGAFALLGAVSPGLNPDSPTLARYDFGGGTFVDALNSVVYAITLEAPDRAWHGHRVGLEERPARGMVALLGTIKERDPPPTSPFPFGGYQAYRDLVSLPKRVLWAEVRPPNGCYDVYVELAPQVIGTASRGDETFVAVARRGEPLHWVVHRVRVVSRALEGPYGGPVACQAAAPPNG